MPFRHHHTGRRHTRVAMRYATAVGVLSAACILAGVGISGVANGAPLVGRGGSGNDGLPAPGLHAAPGAGGALSAPSFTIAGSVGSLFPGKTFALVLTVTNPQTVTITVTSITTTVGNASTHCSAANVKVSSFSGQLHVAAGKTGKATVHVTLVHRAPNACQGAHFPFTYLGSGTGA